MAFYISRTPHRLSFFGGGTDLPAYYNKYPSFVIACSINQYSYLMCRKLEKFNDYKSRIIYSKVECVNSNEEIEHNIVRSVLSTLQVNYGVEIIHSADIPSGGTGASATFTVGLLNCLQSMESRFTSPKGLAESAILVETGLLKESTGIQDAYISAFGGLNMIKMSRDSINVYPIICNPSFVNELEQSCLLIHTGVSRPKINISAECFGNIAINEERLHNTAKLAEEGLAAFRSENIMEISKLIGEAWEIKRQLSPNVSNPKIDEICNKIKFMGGNGRLIGAGGGGFVLAMFPKELRSKFLQEFKDLVVVPFKISYGGSAIIYSGQN